jgi:hypothetical protein
VIDDERPEASDRLRRPPDDASTSEAGRSADQGDLWLGMSPGSREPQADAVALAGNSQDAAAPVDEPPPAAEPGSEADADAEPESEVAAEPAVEAYGPVGEQAVDPDLADALANVGQEGEEAGDTSLLRNPYVLAALAVAGAIILAVIVVVLFGGDAGGAGGAEPTPASATAAPLGIGVLGELTAGSAVRQGPGTEFPELGILPAGRKVNVVGRNQSSTWFQILFPPESQGRGWVSATNVRLPDGAASQLEIVAGTPPTALPPTSTPVPTQPPPTATQPAVATAVPRQVDISLSTAGNCDVGNEMAVNIQNIGSDLESRLVRIVITTPGGTLSDRTFPLALGAGQSVVYNTGQQVQAPRTTATASFVDDPQDRNPANNVATCVVAGGATVVPPPILTPTPRPTP